MTQWASDFVHEAYRCRRKIFITMTSLHWCMQSSAKIMMCEEADSVWEIVADFAIIFNDFRFESVDSRQSLRRWWMHNERKLCLRWKLRSLRARWMSCTKNCNHHSELFLIYSCRAFREWFWGESIKNVALEFMVIGVQFWWLLFGVIKLSKLHCVRKFSKEFGGDYSGPRKILQ